jgi:carbonic anhydrase/acetyltransferase-like protein (isoleucine patch superfamily)
MGSPGKVLRTLSEEDVLGIRDYAERYVGYKKDYA